jgi:uncharacterized membrane protein HdeD (DUF308 family)
MAFILTLSAIVSVIFGIVILAWPKSLNYAIAIWLLLNGILQILYSNGVIA